MVLLFSLVAERNLQAKPDTASAKPARSKSHGPVRVTAEVQPSKANLSDEPVLTLTIDSEEGVVVQKPPFGSTLGGFTIRGLREPLPKISNGHAVDSTDLHLGANRSRPAANRPDQRRVHRPPAQRRRPKAHHRNPAAFGRNHVDLGDKTPSLGDLRRRPTRSGSPRTLPFGSAAWCPSRLAVAAAAWWLSHRRRREKAVNAVILSPQQLANMELDKLVASGLAERDIKQFYVE